MSFWDGMKLWEKMLLVLACAMFAVLIAGTVKLIWMRFQLRKHTKLATEKKAQLEEAGSSQQVIILKKDEIPFGIRALEAGVEVEGVVVSRPATPRASFHNFSNLTLHGSDARDSVASLPSRSSYGAPSPSGGPSITMDHNARASAVQQQLRSVHQPNPAYLGPQGYHSPASTSQNTSPMGTRRSSSENLATLAKLEGRIPQTYSPGQRRLMSSPDGIRVAQSTPSRSPSPPERSYVLGGDRLARVAGSDSSGEEQVLDERRLATQYRSQSTEDDRLRVEQHGDLSLLHSHRLSHAAEVGQLGRRPQIPRTQFTSSQPSLLSYSSISGATTPGASAVSPNLYAMDIAMGEQTTAYRMRTSSDGAPRDATFNAHEADRSNFAYFEVPVAQSGTPSGGLSQEELADIDIEALQPDDASKRSSKKLTKKKRSSA